MLCASTSQCVVTNLPRVSYRPSHVGWSACAPCKLHPSDAATEQGPVAAGALPDLLYLTLHSWMGPFAFVVFAGVAFSGGVYCHRHLPETKGRTLAQIQLILSKDGPAGPRGASPSLRVTAQGAGEHGVASHHGQEEMMRPVSGVHSGVAVGRSRHQQWQPAGTSVLAVPFRRIAVPQQVLR